MGHPHEPASSVAFFHLAVDHACCYLPLTLVPASTTSYEPLSEMGREGIEVQVQAIAGEQGEAARSKALSQGVDDQVGHVLGAGTKLEHWKNLGTRIDGQPEPLPLGGAAQPGGEFVQLDVREV